MKLYKVNKNFFIRRNKIQLNKTRDFKKMNIVFSNNLIKTSNKKEIEKLSKKIRHFLITMNKCPNFNPKILLYNLKKTKFMIDIDTNQRVLGSVCIDRINLFNLRNFSSTKHELMHLASIKRDNYSYIRYALLIEGYTELLTKRYFKNDKIIDAYQVEVLIVKTMESIIGKNYMEKNFFEGNFDKIMEEFKKYLSETEIDSFICSLDKVHEEFLNSLYFNEISVQENLNNIYDKLLVCFKNKSKYLNKEELNDILDNRNWLWEIHYIRNNKYHCLYGIDFEKFNKFKSKFNKNISNKK